MTLRRIWALFLLAVLLPTEVVSKVEKVYQEQLAVVKVPVVDLFIHDPVQIDPPFSMTGSPTEGSCRRAHQLLKNEIVVCHDQRHNATQISCGNVIYGFDATTKEPLTKFWVTTESLAPLKECEAVRFAVPMPLVWKQPLPAKLQKQVPSQKKTIVLLRPWKGYSIGTRLVRERNQDTTTHYGVLIPDDQLAAVVHDRVSKECARVEKGAGVSPSEGRSLFVEALRGFIHYIESLPAGDVIPYVWGGSSCTGPVTESFYNDGRGGWRRPGVTQPLSGYDCSELILRFAQMSGLPYIYKTTGALFERGVALAADKTLQNGDLILIPGHVMIVSDRANNEFFHARGYGTGYGTVHRDTLQNMFKGITSYDELLDAYRKQQKITILWRDGSEQGPYMIKLIDLLATCAQQKPDLQ